MLRLPHTDRALRCRLQALVRLGMSLTPRHQPPLSAPGGPFPTPVERSCGCLFDHLIRLEEQCRR
jgi:hypothetical protein